MELVKQVCKRCSAVRTVRSDSKVWKCEKCSVKNINDAYVEDSYPVMDDFSEESSDDEYYSDEDGE